MSADSAEMARRGALGGRPGLGDKASTFVSMRLPGEMVEALDKIAAAREDNPVRSQLIREMLADGIKRARRAGGGVS